MNELKVFENEQFGQVRTVIMDGEPWLLGKDVAEILKYSNTSKAIRDHVDDEDKLTERIVLSGQNREAVFINESGLYSLIVSSKLPEAKKFKRWITSEVLPSIRKYGMYATEDTVEKMLADPDTMIRNLTALKEEREARRLAEEKNVQLEGEKIQLAEKVEQDKPKVLLADSITASEDTIPVGELAKLLFQNGVEIGRNRLFEKLRSEGFLQNTSSEKNLPPQKAMEMGLFEIQERAILKPNGVILTHVTRVTGKGQAYFINRYITQQKEETQQEVREA